MRSKDHARSAVLCKGVLELSIKAERLWLHGGHNDACHHTGDAAHGMDLDDREIASQTTRKRSADVECIGVPEASAADDREGRAWSTAFRLVPCLQC